MIFAIVNQKGGTGKTTSAINIGAALRQYGHKVLLIDLDPQGNLSYSLGIDINQEPISNFFYEENKLQELIYTTEEGIDVIPSNVDLADVEINIADEPDRANILKKDIKSLDYDFIVIDCAPTLSLLTVNALTAADYVIVPVQLTVLSIQGIEMISDTVKKIKNVLNDRLNILGILPVMVDMRRKISNEVLKYIEDNFELPVFSNKIRMNVRTIEAPSFGQSVIEYAPDCTSSKDYIKLAKEILNKVEK